MAADERLDDLRVERRAAGRDALDRVDELGHVAHAVLEQVADPRGVVADELEHVRRLEVLGEHEHRDGRVRAPDLGGGDAARRPRCPGGMRTSTIATSGVYERTLSSRSSASTGAPDDLVPRSSSSDAIPSRSSALSSATTIRSARCAAGCSVSRRPWR